MDTRLLETATYLSNLRFADGVWPSVEHGLMWMPDVFINDKCMQ